MFQNMIKAPASFEQALVDSFNAERKPTMTATEFLLLQAKTGGRIVSSNDLNNYQISEARSKNLFYVDEATSYGWAIVPWELTTDKDRQREADYFFKVTRPDPSGPQDLEPI